MIGLRFGKLIVIRDSGERRHGAVYYECQCDCGRKTLTSGIRLRNGHTKSCGCLVHNKGRHKSQHKTTHIKKKTQAKIGAKYNKFTIIGFKKEIRKPLIATCQCDCGNIVDRDYKELTKGKIKSCGCIKKEISEKAAIKRIAKELAQKESNKEWKPETDLTGRVFNKLTVLYFCGIRIRTGTTKHSLWYCRCECGRESVMEVTVLKSNRSHCSCHRPQRSKESILLAAKKRKERYLKKLASIDVLDNTVGKHRDTLKKSLRMAVDTKYGHKCLICGSDDNLNYHHLKSFRYHPHLRKIVANIIPLCEQCHMKLHDEVGYINPPLKEQIAFIRKHKRVVGLNDYSYGRGDF